MGTDRSESPGTASGKMKILILALILLLVILIGLPAADVGGIRSAAADRLWHYALENHRVDLARLAVSLGADDRKKNKLLEVAVNKRKAHRARTLLALGANPDIRASNGMTALYWCALRNYPYIADLLVQAGADIDARPFKNWCALSVAIKRHHNKIANLLIDFGADIRTDPENANKSPLWAAAGYGNMEILERLLWMGADTHVVKPSNVPGRRPTSVFDRALSKNQYGAAKRLLRETGPSRLADELVTGEPMVTNFCLAGIKREMTRRSYAGFKRTDINPITDALEKHAPDDTVLSLIDRHPDRVDREDETGETPLLAAAERGRLAVVKRLVERGCDVDKPDGNGYSAALVAAEEGHLEVLRTLVRAGADLSKAGCRDESLFYFVIHREMIEPFKVLVEEKADLDRPDSLGTPLQIALSYGRKEYARILLEAGADPYLKAGHLPAGADYIADNPEFADLKPLLYQQIAQRGGSPRWILKDAKETGKERLHVISVYQGRNPRPGQASRLPVLVSDTAKPLVLVLNSYESIEWQLSVEPGVRLKKVYALGYYPQKITGVDASVPVERSTLKKRLQIKPRYVKNKDDFLDLIDSAQKLTGIRPATVQSAYTGNRFTVDGKETIDFEHAVFDKPPERGVVMIPAGISGAKVSRDGLICSKGRAGAYSLARATAAYNAGKWYFEVMLNPDRGNVEPGRYSNAGLTTSSVPVKGLTGDGSDSGDRYLVPKKFMKGLKGTYVLGIAADLDYRRVYFHINGRWVEGRPGEKEAGLALKPGREYAAVVKVGKGSDGKSDRLMVNFGATPFQHPVPAGYRSYDGKQKGA